LLLPYEVPMDVAYIKSRENKLSKNRGSTMPEAGRSVDAMPCLGVDNLFGADSVGR
jgi:hypothetical protein